MANRKITVDRDKCLHCGACVGACPENALYLNEFIIEIDDKICNGCGICRRMCGIAAIEFRED